MSIKYSVLLRNLNRQEQKLDNLVLYIDFFPNQHGKQRGKQLKKADAPDPGLMLNIPVNGFQVHFSIQTWRTERR